MSRERLIGLQVLVERDNDLVNAGRKLYALYLNEGQRYASSARPYDYGGAEELITSNIAATVSFDVLHLRPASQTFKGITLLGDNF